MLRPLTFCGAPLGSDKQDDSDSDTQVYRLYNLRQFFIRKCYQIIGQLSIIIIYSKYSTVSFRRLDFLVFSDKDDKP